MALAVLLPALITGAWLWALWPAAEERALSAAAADVDAELADAGEVDLLLVGSSHLGRGVDMRQLEGALDLPKGRAHALWRSNIQAPHWYALLKNRVYANGHRPPVVVVVSTLRRTMQTHVEPGLREASLIEQMTADEPVINRLVFGRDEQPGGWGFVKARRTRLREGLLDGLRTLTVGALFVRADELVAEGGGEPASRWALGDARAREAFERLFVGDNARDMSLAFRAVPVVEAARGRDEDSEALAPVAQTFVPEIISLVQEGGGRVVFVDLPVSPKVSGEHEVPPAVRRDFVDALNAAGAGFIDLHRLELDQRDFRDLTHLNPKGAKKVTAALAEALQGLGVLGEAPIPAHELSLDLLLQPTFRRDGDPPALPAGALSRDKGACALRLALGGGEPLSEPELKRLGPAPSSPVVIFDGDTPLVPFGKPDVTTGDTCHGQSWYAGVGLRFTARSPVPDPLPEGRFRAALAPELPLKTPQGDRYWVYPGTSLVLDLPAEASLDGQALEVDAVVRLAGPGAPPVLSVGGGAPQPFAAQGSLWSARATHSPGAGPWSIAISGPPDGAFALVSHLRVRGPAGTAAYIGEEVDEAWKVEVQGLSRQGAQAVRFPNPPPPLPAPEKAPRPVPQKAAVIVVPRIASIAETHISEALGVPFASPVRITEDGVVIDQRPGSCLVAREKGGGVWCHRDERLFISATDGSIPGENGKTYGVTLTEERGMGGGWWVYPGDRMLGPLDRPRVGQVPGDVMWLLLKGWAFGDPARAALTVELWLDGEQVFAAVVTGAQLARGQHRIDLPRERWFRDDRRASIRITTEEDGEFFWIKDVLLGHDRRQAGG